MSHYAVMVIGDDPEKQLYPYAEQVDEDDARCRFIDQTDEVNERFANDKIRRALSPEGEYLDPWDERFRVKGTFGMGTASHKIEEPYKEVEIPANELYSSVDEFAKDYMRYEVVDGRFGYYANPGAKWDWYQLGGRFSGELILKPGFDGGLGDPGVFDNGPAHENGVDQAYSDEIDWEAMRNNPEEVEHYSRFWDVVVEGVPPRDKEEGRKLWSLYKPEFYLNRYKTKERFIQCQTSISFWAVVKDGIWHEKGEMGWFAISDETDAEALDWEENFYNRFIKNLPAHTLISIYDCHI